MAFLETKSQGLLFPKLFLKIEDTQANNAAYVENFTFSQG